MKIPGMTGIEACVFDAYDTLFDLNSAAKANGYRVPWCNRLIQAPARIPEQPDGEIRRLATLPEIIGAQVADR